MAKFISYLKRIILVMPIVSILGASFFFHLQAWGQQALVLFALVWFYAFILFDVLGK